MKDRRLVDDVESSFAAVGRWLKRIIHLLFHRSDHSDFMCSQYCERPMVELILTVNDCLQKFLDNAERKIGKPVVAGKTSSCASLGVLSLGAVHKLGYFDTGEGLSSNNLAKCDRLFVRGNLFS